MPPKTSPAARRPAAPRTKRGAVEIVVRRGAMRRFDALKSRTSALPVQVTWDRRTDERRNAGVTADVTRDRRQTERRKRPPFTWDLADFVVVEPTKRQKTARKKTSRKP